MISARRTASFTALCALVSHIVMTAVIGTCVVSCARSRSLTFPTAHELPEKSELSTTSVIDQPTAYPQVQTSSTDRLVLLTAPIAAADALRIVRLLFDAIVSEDVEALTKLITDDARHQLGAGVPTEIVEVWQQRFGNEDLSQLDPSELYVESEVKVFRYDDVKEGNNSKNGKCEHLCAQTMQPSDLLVIVEIQQPFINSSRVFSDTMTLVLHGDQGASRIKVMQEVIKD